ncbi:MAG: tyrosine-type recombinase/integrase [Desulfonatronovibrio sp.]
MAKKKIALSLGFHAIRHFTASVLFHEGQSLAVIQSVLRHKSSSTTERYLRNSDLRIQEKLWKEFLRKEVRAMLFHLTKKKPLKFLLQGLENFRRLWLWQTGCNLLKFMASPRGFEPLFPA